MNKKEETFLPHRWPGAGEGSYDGTRGSCMDARTGPPGLRVLPSSLLGCFPRWNQPEARGRAGHRGWGPRWAWSWGVGNAWKEVPWGVEAGSGPCSCLLAAAPASVWAMGDQHAAAKFYPDSRVLSPTVVEVGLAVFIHRCFLRLFAESSGRTHRGVTLVPVPELKPRFV